MSDCCSPINIPPNCPNQCNQITDACCVKDETAYSCIGTAAEATQCQINAAVNTKLCQIQNANTPCFGSQYFHDLTLTAPFTQLVDYQTAQYSDLLFCTVRLRGSITFTTPGEAICFEEQIASPLATGLHPTAERMFSIVLMGTKIDNDCLPAVGQLHIKTNGEIWLRMRISDAAIESYIFSLDGISFEI